MISPLIGLTSSCNIDTAVPTLQHLPLHLPKPELWFHWVFLFSLMFTTLFLRFPRQRGQHLLNVISVFLRLHNSLLPFITLLVSTPPEERDNYTASIVFICFWSTMHSLGFIFLGKFCVAISKGVKKLYRHHLTEGNMAHLCLQILFGGHNPESTMGACSMVSSSPYFWNWIWWSGD